MKISNKNRKKPEILVEPLELEWPTKTQIFGVLLFVFFMTLVWL